MRAEVISIGTELLLGDINDTNATFIAQSLREIGLDLLYRTTVGDNEERIAQVINVALDRADVVITTGGLGPTVDDVTREGIANATGRPLEFHQSLLDQIQERFRRFGVRMTDNNHRQAYAPQGAILVENPVGTAPVFILETERGVVLTLPGVPREMEHLLREAFIPWLKKRIGHRAVIRSLVLRTAGIGESQVDAKIADLMVAANPTVGLAAHSGQTDIRITAKAGSDAEADRLISPIEAEIRSRVGEWIYATGSQPIEEVVAALLAAKQASLAIVEHGTHGALNSRMQAAAKEHGELQVFPVDFGAAPDAELPALQAAEQAAERARVEQSAGFGLAAIVHESTANGDKSTDIGLALATEDGIRSRAFSWGAERTDGHVWVTTHALAQLWRYLASLASPPQA